MTLIEMSSSFALNNVSSPKDRDPSSVQTGDTVGQGGLHTILRLLGAVMASRIFSLMYGNMILGTSLVDALSTP